MITRIACVAVAVLATSACHDQPGERLHEVVERYCAYLQRHIRDAADDYDHPKLGLVPGDLLVDADMTSNEIGLQFDFCLSARLIDNEHGLDLNRRFLTALSKVIAKPANPTDNFVPIHQLADLADEINSYPIRE